MKKILTQIFSADQALSSKRIFGAIGFIGAIVIIFMKKPEYVDYLLYTSASLLGLETIAQAFKKNDNNNQQGGMQ